MNLIFATQRWLSSCPGEAGKLAAFFHPVSWISRRTVHFFILALHLRLFDIAHRSCNFFNSAKELTATFGMILRIMESRLSNHAEQECDERVSDSFSRGIMMLHFCELDAQVFSFERLVQRRALPVRCQIICVMNATS